MTRTATPEPPTAPLSAWEAVSLITRQVEEWPGVTAADHRFGGVEFRHGRRELGHVHDRGARAAIADLPLPRDVRDGLIAEGRARAHHVLPSSGWVTVDLDSRRAVADVVGLLWDAYERSVRTALRRAGA